MYVPYGSHDWEKTLVVKKNNTTIKDILLKYDFIIFLFLQKYKNSIDKKQIVNTFCYLCKVLNSEFQIMKQYYKYLLLFFVLVFAVHVTAQTNTWKDSHKVKKKETIFGIAKDYGVSIQDLIDHNPEMKQEGYELKKGSWILVPYAKEDDKKYTSNTAK